MAQLVCPASQVETHLPDEHTSVPVHCVVQSPHFAVVLTSVSHTSALFVVQFPITSTEGRLALCGVYAAVAVHGLEHLGTTDRGISMFRNQIRRGIRAVKAGKDIRAETIC